jgi:hypothetical protein
MIDNDELEKLTRNISVKVDYNRTEVWKSLLDINPMSDDDFILKRAILGAAGQFNYWEEDGKIVWPAISSDDWFKVVTGKKPITEMNLCLKRTEIYVTVSDFLKNNQICVMDPVWWDSLSFVFGGDPLRKRETLLWIMLTDLGYENLPAQKKGCIDYNIMLFLRFSGVIKEYGGNIFNLYEETKLRTECLEVIERILDKRKDLTIQKLDSFLYFSGKEVRHIMDMHFWEPYFCYRLGCFFY